MAHASRKEYFIVFFYLAVLTMLEIGVVKIGLSTLLKGSALVLLALAKATAVALFYMHLKSEVKILKVMIAIPMCIPLIYALVLCVEAAVRLGVWG